LPKRISPGLGGCCVQRGEGDRNFMLKMENWKEKKEEHLKLSAAAADKYDELYETTNFATGSYMNYELETIKKFIDFAPSKSIALDLGCGTGRGCFYLSKFFDKVYGYDFSPEMILVCNKNKISRRKGNVSFETRDVEEDALPWESNTISFVNTAFGMGSFFENVENLFREVKRILLPKGIAIFSFYNSEALVNKLELQWEPALAARVVTNGLNVSFEGKKFEIPARAYNVKEIEKRIKGSFGEKNILEITTFPTLSALFPQELFQRKEARDLCTNVDNMLSNNLEIAAGPYIIVVCKKAGNIDKQQPIKGYENVLSLLRTYSIDTTIRIKEHNPVRTMDDVKKVLNVEANTMVKSILITVDNNMDEKSPKNDNSLFLIGIPSDRKLDFAALATILGISRKRLEMASQSQVEDMTGFKVGSIPPFGLPKNIPVIIDLRVLNLKEIWCGTGKSTESIRLTLEELKMLSTPTFYDISKPL